MHSSDRFDNLKFKLHLFLTIPCTAYLDASNSRMGPNFLYFVLNQILLLQSTTMLSEPTQLSILLRFSKLSPAWTLTNYLKNKKLKFIYVTAVVFTGHDPAGDKIHCSELAKLIDYISKPHNLFTDLAL